MNKWIQKFIGIKLPTSEELKQHHQQHNNQQQEVHPIGVLQFTLMNDGGVNLLCEWADQTIPIADIYAELLYNINKGNLKNDLFNTLESYTHEDLTKKPFIYRILETWNKYSDEPLISPTEALKINAVQTHGMKMDTIPMGDVE